MAAPPIDTGSTAWLLTSAALVLIMTPGVAFFYGGMVRSKNVLAMLMQNYATMAVVSVLWVLGVYSLAFGTDAFGGLVGGLDQVGLAHMQQAVAGYTGDLAQSVPPLVFVAFQLMFAIITPALITGAIADRFKFGAYLAVIAAWIILVYGPIAHWVFSPQGWLFRLGALDFAGGTVVHINAGAAGLALALLVGRRLGWPGEPMKPHNLPLVLLGAALLWFGWFGFNAGSALGANQLAGYAFVNTNTAAAAALLGWLLVEKVRDGHPTTLGAASGAVAGLVAITPAAGFVSPLGAIVIGLLAGIVCACAVALKYRLRYDDSLDVVAVHLVGGVVGSLCVGLFATTAVNAVGGNGLLYGGGLSLLGKQALAVGVVLAYSFVATLVIGKVVDVVLGLRVTRSAEAEGLDTAEHAETAYDLGVRVGGVRAAPLHRPAAGSLVTARGVDA
ncbi:MAG: ammonium transporter [Mycobacterium leprae]